MPVPRRSTSGSRPLRERRDAALRLASREGDRSGPPPRLAVEGPAGRKEHGLTLPIYLVTYIKPMSLREGDHGRG